MSTPSNAGRTLYGFWLSPYMSQVAHFLSETGLAYRYERVSPFQFGGAYLNKFIDRRILGGVVGREV
jgi:glutathione S-transferase